jgi:sporulation protein YlmC with PRC-barrel domain
MLYTEVIGRKVVSTATAETVGLVDGLVVDPARHTAVALALSKTPAGPTMLPWGRISAFGSDAVTVPGADVLVEDERLAELAAAAHDLLGKRVLTTEGYFVGTVHDVEFDAGDGTLTTLVLENYRWDAAALLGSGSFAAVVRPQQLQAPRDLIPTPDARR